MHLMEKEHILIQINTKNCFGSSTDAALISNYPKSQWPMSWINANI